MNTYRVVWEIDIFDAGSAVEAAERALRVQRNPHSEAIVFSVRAPDGTVVNVDLVEEE